MITPRGSEGKFLKGFHYSTDTQFKKGETSPRKGVSLNDSIKNKISINRKGLATWSTGSRKQHIPQYNAIHKWLKYNYGKASLCELCESTKNVQWANLSGEYKRDLKDFAQLCASCHRKHDLSMNYYRQGGLL